MFSSDIFSCIFQFLGIDLVLQLKLVCKTFHNAIHSSTYVNNYILNYNILLSSILKGKYDTVIIHRHYIRFREYEFLTGHFGDHYISYILALSYEDAKSITGHTINYYLDLIRPSYFIIKIHCESLRGKVENSLYLWIDFAFDFFTRQLLIYCFMEHYETIQEMDNYEYELPRPHYDKEDVMKFSEVSDIKSFLSGVYTTFIEEPLGECIFSKLSHKSVAPKLRINQLRKNSACGNIFVSLLKV